MSKLQMDLSNIQKQFKPDELMGRWETADRKLRVEAIQGTIDYAVLHFNIAHNLEIKFSGKIKTPEDLQRVEKAFDSIYRSVKGCFDLVRDRIKKSSDAERKLLHQEEFNECYKLLNQE